MGNSSAKIHISLSQGILDLEGDEEFVSSQLKELRPLIEKAFQNAALSSPPPVTPPKPNNEGNKSFDNFSNVFADADGKIQILKTLPGGNKAQKSVNAAMLLAYANTLKGNATTPYKDVRMIINKTPTLGRMSTTTGERAGDCAQRRFGL